jgi:pyruvate kinase
MISRLSPRLWIVALSRDPAVCQGLAFSYGVEPVELGEDPKNWRDFAKAWLRENGVSGPIALLVAGPSRQNPEANYRLEFLKIEEFTTDLTVEDIISQRSSSPFTQNDAVAR